MPYSAEISRVNPSCLLFLIDQSASMADPVGAGEFHKLKADGVAEALNRLLQTLVLKCAKSEGIRDYYHVGVLGYGANVGPALGGALAGRDLVLISEIADMPTRLEERPRKVEDGAGGVIEQTFKFPIWVDPVAEGGTPMCQALTQAHNILQRWLAEHTSCFPPVVINMTDGEATDGDPSSSAQALQSLASRDGNVLLFNLHISSHRATPIMFPDTEEHLPDQYAQLLFRISSLLPPHLQTAAQQEDYPVTAQTRGFVFNAHMVALIQFLSIGTQPSNLR